MVGRRAVALALLLAAASASLATAATAATAATPTSSRTAMILARALVYDKNLAERAGADVTVLVADRADGTCAAEMTAAFSALPSGTLKGLPLKIAQVTLSDAAALDTAISLNGADAVFLCDGADVAMFAPVLAAHKVVGMAGTRAAVANGLALGAVVDATGGAKVIVNLPASKSSGVEFATDLFALAEVIR